ncbi:MAG: hypothetical protein ACI4WR_02005 [Bulleidia sp.]
MASQITNYQFPACSGPMHYEEKSGKLACDRYLPLASENHPVDHPLWKVILMFSGISTLILISICMILKQQMKLVGMKRTAAVYSSGNLVQEKRSVCFLNTTVSRKKDRAEFSSI